ncbi:MAG: hypothetical protein Q7R55_00990 [Candidatus Wildermuthbacteria bacterium]|nr:hypothetical protein [Candidatus Wildermuthbacteria bacterium]
MESSILQLLFFLEAVVLGSVIFMHLASRNSSVVRAYMAQSFAVSALLLLSSFGEWTFPFLALIAVIFAVKVVIAPRFFFSLIKKHELKFSGSKYLNTPITLMALACLTALAYSYLFKPLVVLFAQNHNALLLAVAVILISLFLIINRKGALSQMVGILSLENGIVSFAVLSGLEQSVPLQLGILFDMSIWIVIATVFTSMIYKQFWSLDVSMMGDLTED